jgi:hypothetical protein
VAKFLAAEDASDVLGEVGRQAGELPEGFAERLAGLPQPAGRQLGLAPGGELAYLLELLGEELPGQAGLLGGLALGLHRHLQGLDLLFRDRPRRLFGPTHRHDGCEETSERRAAHGAAGKAGDGTCHGVGLLKAIRWSIGVLPERRKSSSCRGAALTP